MINFRQAGFRAGLRGLGLTKIADEAAPAQKDEESSLKKYVVPGAAALGMAAAAYGGHRYMSGSPSGAPGSHSRYQSLLNRVKDIVGQGPKSVGKAGKGTGLEGAQGGGLPAPMPGLSEADSRLPQGGAGGPKPIPAGPAMPAGDAGMGMGGLAGGAGRGPFDQSMTPGSASALGRRMQPTGEAAGGGMGGLVPSGVGGPFG